MLQQKKTCKKSPLQYYKALTNYRTTHGWSQIYKGMSFFDNLKGLTIYNQDTVKWILSLNRSNRGSVCVVKDMSNRQTDMVYFYVEACYKSK